MKKPTITDVAKLAGVSIGTASRAFNKKPGVSDEKSEKVHEAAKKLKYFPSIVAQQLRENKSNVITLHIMLPQDNEIHPSTWVFYFPIIQGFSDELIKEKMRLHLEFNHINELSDPSRLVSYLRGYNIQGAAFITPFTGDYNGLLKLKEYSIPVVTLYGRIYDSISSIDIDNLSAAYNVTNWLLRLGHEKITFIGAPETDFAAVERKNGYLKAMEGSKNSSVFRGNWDLESGSQQLKRIISQDEIPSAIFCANDHMAIGVLNACMDLRLQIPDKISLVGFDDSIICQVSNPKLTSVRMPLYEMGQQAASILKNERANKITGVVHRLLKAELKIRSSVVSLSEQNQIKRV